MKKIILLPGSVLPPHNVYEVLMLIDGQPRVESFSGQSAIDAQWHAKCMFPESPIHIARENAPFSKQPVVGRWLFIGAVAIVLLAIAASTLYMWSVIPR